MLADLGFTGSSADEVAYRFLLSCPSATTAEIAQAVGRSCAEAEQILQRLCGEGLVAAAPHPGEEDPVARWTALPPETALGPGLTRMRERLRHAESTLSALNDVYQREHGDLSPGEVVEFIDGQAAQARRLLEFQGEARESLWLFQTGANTVAPVPTTITEQPAAPPGLEYRVVVDRDFLAEPQALRALNERLAEGHQVRVVDHPLTKLVIADRRVAMVRTSPQRTMVLRQPLVSLACELFEATWRRARPYLRDDSGLEPVDRQILQLMLSGLTDTATAHQVGTSPRTVQRRLRALMDAAHVTSRLQLAWYAMRNNWL